MCVHIRIEVLAASAIIGILDSTANDRFVSFATLDEYGVKVAQKLQNENEAVYWIYSREQVDAFFSDYSNLFERGIKDKKEGIRLKDGVVREDLVHRFLMQLTCKLEQALMDPAVLDVLKRAA